MFQFSNSSKSTQIMINISSNNLDDSNNSDTTNKLETKLSKLVDDTLKDAYQQINQINKEVLYHPIFDDATNSMEQTKHITSEQLQKKGFNIPAQCPICHTKLKFFEKKYPKKERNFSKPNCFIECPNCEYSCSDFFWHDTINKFYEQVKDILIENNKTSAKKFIVAGILIYLIFDWPILASICTILGMLKWFFNTELINSYINTKYLQPSKPQKNKELSVYEEYVTMVDEITQKISMHNNLQTDTNINQLMQILIKIKNFMDEHKEYHNQLNYIINSTRLISRLIDIKTNMRQYGKELQKDSFNNELDTAIEKSVQVHKQFYQKLVDNLMDKYSATVSVASQLFDESIKQ